MLCYNCGRIGHRETQCTERLTCLTTVLPHENAPHTPIVPTSEPAYVATPWKTVQTRRSRARGRLTEGMQQHKNILNENYQGVLPRGPASMDHAPKQSTHFTETVKRLESKNAFKTPGFNREKVALNRIKEPDRQPRETMQKQGLAECPQFPLHANDVAGNTMQSACMASWSERQQGPFDHTMQHENNICPITLSDPTPQDTNLNDGSLIGPSFNLSHANGSRPSTHTNTSRHPTLLKHTPHAQPFPSSPSLRAGDGEPRKAVERFVARTNSRRDSELCPDTGSSADSHELEPSNSNSEPASKARPTSPLQPTPQPPFPCSSQQVQPSLPHPSKEDTSFTGQAEEHSGELLQCRLTGHTARSHFSLPGSRRNKHRPARRRTQPLHSHVLKPQPTIRRVRHALDQAR